MAECVFCDIVAGVAPVEMVAASHDAVAFLDRSPLFKGHVLVVPRLHVTTIGDLPAALLAPYFGLIQRVAAVMPSALEADGSFIAMNNVVSQSVPHVHAHVVPRRRKDGLRGFFWPRQKYADAAEAALFASRLRGFLNDV